MTRLSVAREISYSGSAGTRAGSCFIRTVENLTGRPKMIKRADGYEDEVANGADFWQVMMSRYGIDLNFVAGNLQSIPKKGPLVVVSNHPFGIMDGLILGHILRERRGDFRIVANDVFLKAEDVKRVILPISFAKSREALKLNLDTRATAVQYLKEGGCIGIFPGGTVSTSARLMSSPMDPKWRNFTAKMIQKSGATVVPLYFQGSNSRAFQFASHIHSNLRLALLIREFKRQINTPVPLIVGEPLTSADFASYKNDPAGLMDFLRTRTYHLAPGATSKPEYGHEFEEQHR
jgi:putative hemolysin